MGRKHDATNQIVLEFVSRRRVQGCLEESWVIDDGGGTLIDCAAALPYITIHVERQPRTVREVGCTNHMQFTRSTIIGDSGTDVVGWCR